MPDLLQTVNRLTLIEGALGRMDQTVVQSQWNFLQWELTRILSIFPSLFAQLNHWNPLRFFKPDEFAAKILKEM